MEDDTEMSLEKKHYYMKLYLKLHLDLILLEIYQMKIIRNIKSLGKLFQK